MKFIDFKYLSTSGVQTQKDPDRWLSKAVSTYEMGIIADGGSHPLSSRYATLAQAQTDYPFVTSLAQEIDWAATQQASNIAFGIAGSENGSNTQLNRPIHLIRGTYYFGNDTWLIRNLASARIIGDGQLVTKLTGNNIILQFDGLWYSVLESFSLQAVGGSPVAILDIDGNVPGQPYSTRSVQGNDLVNMSIFGGGFATYGLALCRQSAGAAQGSECQYRNVHFSNCTTACYYQNGSNALNNIFLGGDMQIYSMHGIYVIGGDCKVLGTSFEPQGGYNRIINGGYDIYVGDSGSYTTVIVNGCRTEGPTFFHNGGAVFGYVTGCSQALGEPTILAWQANTNYPAGSTVKVVNLTDQTVIGQLFHTVAGGLSGAIQPTWPFTGAGTPVVDNAVTWNEVVFDVVQNLRGSFDFPSCKMQVGRIRSTSQLNLTSIVTANHTIGYETVCLVDATSGPITINLPYDWNLSAPTATTPWIIYIKKIDATANAVTIHSTLGIDAGGNYTIAGGSQGFVQFIMGTTAVTGTPTWNIIGHS